MAVNQKLVDEVVSKILVLHGNGIRGSVISAHLQTLPEFRTPEWIRCSERMPEDGECIWITSDNNLFTLVKVASATFDDGLFRCIGRVVNPQHVTHWMPRHVPAPPVEEESELMKELKSKLGDNCGNVGISWAIEIVKRHEQKAKK